MPFLLFIHFAADPEKPVEDEEEGDPLVTNSKRSKPRQRTESVRKTKLEVLLHLY
jgi:hypothetical protein